MVQVLDSLLRDVVPDDHRAVMAAGIPGEDELELVLAAALFGCEEGFEDGGVGDDLGAQVADGEVCVGVVDGDCGVAGCCCRAVAW